MKFRGLAFQFQFPFTKFYLWFVSLRDKEIIKKKNLYSFILWKICAKILLKKYWFIQFFFSVKSIKMYGLKELAQALIKQKKKNGKFNSIRELKFVNCSSNCSNSPSLVPENLAILFLVSFLFKLLK